MSIPLPPVPGPQITPQQLLTPMWQSWFKQLYTYLSASASAGGGTVPVTTVITANAPLKWSGTLGTSPTIGFLPESMNTVFAGPASGAAATPTFRALVSADVPPSILPGGFSGFANPSASVGLTAINGIATTAMRSDAAPALSQAIAPTWTGAHIFSGANPAVSVTGAASAAASINLRGNGNPAGSAFTIQQAAGNQAVLNQQASANLLLQMSGVNALTINTSLAAQFAGNLSCNNVAPPAQLTGWGTPVGNAVINNYNITDAGGSGSNTNKVVAQCVATFKALGVWAA